LREQMQAVEGEEAGVDNGADGRRGNGGGERGDDRVLQGCRALEREAVWRVPLQVEETARVVETVLDVQVVPEVG